MAKPGRVSRSTACWASVAGVGAAAGPGAGPGVQPHDAAPGAGGVAGAGDEVVAARLSRRRLVGGVAGRRPKPGSAL